MLESSLGLIDEVVEKLFVAEFLVLVLNGPLDFNNFSWVSEWMSQIFNDVVKHPAQPNVVNLFDLLLVLVHCELLELFWVLDDINYSLLLGKLVHFLLVLIEEAILDDLVDLVVVTIMDSSLIENVVLEVVWSFFTWNSHFGLSETGDEAELLQDLVFVNFISGIERSTE